MIANDIYPFETWRSDPVIAEKFHLKAVENLLTDGVHEDEREEFLDFFHSRIALLVILTRECDQREKYQWVEEPFRKVTDILSPPEKAWTMTTDPHTFAAYYIGWISGLNQSLMMGAVSSFFRKRRLRRLSKRLGLDIAAATAGADIFMMEAFSLPQQALYQRGRSDALTRFLNDDGRFDSGSDTIVIFALMIVFCDKVIECKSVTELHGLLGEVIPSNQLGDIERLRKLCQRIGLRLKGRGAPRGW